MTMKFKEKLLNVQKNLIAQKGQYNSFGKYKYRSTEDILEALKPLLYEFKLTQTITDEIVMVGDRLYVKSTVTVYDTETEESLHSNAYAREPKEQKGMSDSQVTGSASSYARKYALNGMYAIDDTKDADTDEYNAQVNQKKPKPQSKPQAKENGDRVATEKEVMYMFEVDKTLSTDQIKEIVKNVTGKETTKGMKLSELNEVIIKIKALGSN